MKENQKVIRIKSVLERDIGLLLLREFYCNRKFAEFFMSKLGVNDFTVVEVAHSVVDVALGESDLMILFKSHEICCGLLIENKIDAIAMDNQSQRYIERATKLQNSGSFEKFYIVIVAPELYLITNHEASQYPFAISYEEIIEFFNQETRLEDRFNELLLQEAVDKQSIGYQPIEDHQVTAFWKFYYYYKKEHFPHLLLNEVKGPRGSSEVWPWFDTHHKQVKIAHKSDKGYVDLTILGLSEAYNKVRKVTSERLDSDMTIRITGKSTAIRVEVPIIDFKHEF